LQTDLPSGSGRRGELFAFHPRWLGPARTTKGEVMDRSPDHPGDRLDATEQVAAESQADSSDSHSSQSPPADEDTGWYYLKLWTDEYTYNHDPNVLGVYTEDPNYFPIEEISTYFYRVQGKGIAERIVRLFNKSLKPELTEEGETELSLDFSCRAVEEFDEDQQFLIQDSIDKSREHIETGKPLRDAPLASERLYDQARRWEDKLSLEAQAAATVSDLSPETLRVILPTGIAAALALSSPKN